MRFLSMVLQVCVFAGVVLAFAAVTAYGEATVVTDKENYQAGETVYITGTGWTPGETVSLTIYEDSVQTLRATLYAFADTTGNIANGEFVIEEGDSNTVFRLAAEGLTSGAVAETTFFDGYYVRWVTVGSQTPSPVQAGSSATYTVTVGGYRWCWWWCYCYSQYTNLTITTSLPPGVTYSFNASVVLAGGSNCTATSTLTITTSGGTPPGTTSFQVKATNVYDSGDYATTTGVLTIVPYDVTPPVPNVDPLPVVMGECSATITTYPTATDDVSGTVVGTTSDPLTYTAQGAYTVHWTYTDAAGNNAYQDQQVIVQDLTPPIFASCAPDITVDAGPGECSAVISYDYPAVSDNCAGTLAFAPAVNYPGFASPIWGSTGDLDGDGDIDLVVNNGGATSVGVLLNNGDGTFAAVVDIPSGALNNERGRISDLDGDGDNDLVVTSSYSGSVVVMINHGDATFAAPVSYPAARPSDVCVRDLDGDGDNDLAVSQSYTEGILVMFNRGDGTFTAGGAYPNGDHGGLIVTSDFDADGDYDLAAGSECSGVWLHFNHGDGTFDPSVNCPVAACNHEICLSNLDGDGDDDLVVGYGDVYGDVPYFSVLLNHGDGTFAAMANYPITGGRSVPGAADLDGDGDADLAVASPRLHIVSLLLNHGDGTFSPPVATYDVGDSPQHICSADLDGDGDVDLATVNNVSNDVSVLLNTSAGVVVSATHPSGSTFLVGTTPITLTASDPAGNTATCSFNVTVRPFPGTTCGGSDVVVAPVDSATGTSPVTFTFAEVTGAGETSLEITGVGPPPPFGFRLGVPPTYFELATTATYAGPVTICIDYNAISFGNEGSLKLCHREDSRWVDRTVSLDTLSNVICASVSTFSTFAVFEKVPPASVLGVVTADCPTAHTPLYGVTIDAYEVGTGVLVGSDATDENGCYAIDSLEAGHYSVTIITPLGYAAAADEVPVTVEGVDQTADFALTCVEITAKPRSIGFWKHQVAVATGGNGQGEVDAERLCSCLDLIEAHFNNHRINSVAVYTPPTSGLCGDKLQVAKDLLNLKGDAAMTARAKQQLMALLLNVAAGKIGLPRVISEDGATLSQAITYCDRLIDDSAGDHETAKTIADLINNGTMVPAGMIPLDTEQIAYGPPHPETDVPVAFALSQNIPNPFNPTTDIRFDLPVGAHVDLAVFEVSGRLVRRLVGEWMPAGRHSVEWDGRDDGGRTVASGVYFYRVRAGDFTATRRMVLVR